MMNPVVRLVIAVLVVVSTVACGLTGAFTENPVDADQTPSAAEPEATPVSEATAEDGAGESAAGLLVETTTRLVDGMEMARIPEGEFSMGDDASAFAPEKPAHVVMLDAYWIDVYEVTNAQYRACVEAEICPEPRNWWNDELSGDDQPVLVHVGAAETYCEWVGARLPTEAEWEKAARGPDGRTWPWGNTFVAGRANLSGPEDGYGATAPVGSFPGDRSPYGLLDVAGNAGEWVSDWFDTAYYAHSPTSNPTGPASGEQRVHRAPIANGGGGPEKSRTTARYAADPNWEFGIRCASAMAP